MKEVLQRKIVVLSGLLLLASFGFFGVTDNLTGQATSVTKDYLCDGSSNQLAQDHCYSLQALDTQEKRYCAYITHQEIKDNCYLDLGECSFVSNHQERAKCYDDA